MKVNSATDRARLVLKGKGDEIYGDGAKSVTFGDGSRQSVHTFEGRVKAYFRICEENDLVVDYTGICDSVLGNKYLGRNSIRQMKIAEVVGEYAAKDESLEIMPTAKKSVLERLVSIVDNGNVAGLKGVAGRYNAVGLNGEVEMEMGEVGAARVAHRYGAVGFDNVDDRVIDLTEVVREPSVKMSYVERLSAKVDAWQRSSSRGYSGKNDRFLGRGFSFLDLVTVKRESAGNVKSECSDGIDDSSFYSGVKSAFGKIGKLFGFDGRPSLKERVEEKLGKKVDMKRWQQYRDEFDEMSCI